MSAAAPASTVCLYTTPLLYRVMLERGVHACGLTALPGGARRADELEAEVAACQPDLLLWDPRPPRGGLALALSRLRSASPRVRIVLLAHRAYADEIEDALRNGCDGVLGKEELGQDLGLALDAVLRGVPYVSRDTCRHLLPEAC